MAAKKILIIAGDFSEDYEVMVPYQALLAVGHIVHTACPDRKAGDFIPTAIHDFEGFQTFTEKRGHNFTLNTDFASVKSQDYDALLLPGGRGPEYLQLDERVLALVREFDAAKKPIAAVCHAVQILASAGILKGRTCTGYISVTPEVERTGGTWAGFKPDASNAHIDGNLVTGAAWPAHPEWIKGFLKVLGTKIEL